MPRQPKDPQQPKRKKSAYGGGSVYQRQSDGRYVAKYKNPDTNETVTRYRKTKKEAEKALEDIKFEIRQGTLVTGPNPKVKAFLIQWLDDVHKLDVNPNTYYKHRSIIYSRIIPALGHIELKKLTPQQVQKFYTDLQTVGKKKSSIYDVHKVLRVALKTAVQWGLVPHNVCDKIKRPNPGKKQHYMLTEEQIKRLLQVAEKHVWMEAFLKLVMTTGMRHGELLALQWEDISFDNATLQIRRNVAYIPGQGYVVGPPKTESGNRTIALPAFVLRALRKHQDYQIAQKNLAGEAWQDRHLVFSGAHGGYLSEHVSLRAYRDVLKEAGLPQDMTMHDLRHNVSTFLQKVLKYPPSFVQALLGHSSANITLTIYTHVDPSELRPMMDDLDRILGD